MDIFKQTYYIYVRNLKIWVTQPATLIPPLFISGFLFIIFGAAFGEVTRCLASPRTTMRPS